MNAAAASQHAGSGGWSWLVIALILAAVACFLLAAMQRRRGR